MSFQMNWQRSLFLLAYFCIVPPFESFFLFLSMFRYRRAKVTLLFLVHCCHEELFFSVACGVCRCSGTQNDCRPVGRQIQTYFIYTHSGGGTTIDKTSTTKASLPLSTQVANESHSHSLILPGCLSRRKEKKNTIVSHGQCLLRDTLRTAILSGWFAA